MQGLIIPPRPVQEHQAHRTPKPSGHAVSSKATLSREHGPWFEPGSKYRLFWCLASFLVPASSQCEGANFCTLCHFHNSCHLRTCSRFVPFPHFFHFLHLGTNLFTCNPTTRSSGQKEKASRVTCDENRTCTEPAVRYQFLDSG